MRANPARDLDNIQRLIRLGKYAEADDLAESAKRALATSGCGPCRQAATAILNLENNV